MFRFRCSLRVFGALAVMLGAVSACGGGGNDGARIPALDLQPHDFAPADLSTPEAVMRAAAAMPLAGQPLLLPADPAARVCDQGGSRSREDGEAPEMNGPFEREPGEPLNRFTRWGFNGCRTTSVPGALSGVVTRFCGADDECQTTQVTVLGEGETPVLDAHTLFGASTARYVLRGQHYRFQSGGEQKRQVVGLVAGQSIADPANPGRTFVGFAGETPTPLTVSRMGASIMVSGPYGLHDEGTSLCLNGAVSVETLTPLVAEAGSAGEPNRYSQGRLRFTNRNGDIAVLQLGADQASDAVIEIDGQQTLVSAHQLRVALPECWR